jgi:cell division protein FtsN
MMTTPIDKNMNNDMAMSNKDILMTGISKSALRWVIASLSLILFTTIICLSYSIGVSDAEHGAIPIIRADGSAVKIRPDNPGGRQYPHQDLTIYNSFRDDISEKNNQLRDNLEKPMQAIPTEQINDNAHTSNVTNQTHQNTNVAPSQEDDVSLTTVSAQTPKQETTPPSVTMQTTDAETQINKIMTDNNNTVNNPVKPVLQQITQPKPVATLTGTSGNFLQIGAFRSETDALAGFNRAKSKFNVLSNAGYNIAKADLGAKGIYYRLRVGPFASKEQSLAFCSKLQAQGQPCLHIAQ